jgi:hypothetical protein
MTVDHENIYAWYYIKKSVKINILQDSYWRLEITKSLRMKLSGQPRIATLCLHHDGPVCTYLFLWFGIIYFTIYIWQLYGNAVYVF